MPGNMIPCTESPPVTTLFSTHGIGVLRCSRFLSNFAMPRFIIYSRHLVGQAYEISAASMIKRYRRFVDIAPVFARVPHADGMITPARPVWLLGTSFCFIYRRSLYHACLTTVADIHRCRHGRHAARLLTTVWPMLFAFMTLPSASIPAL